MWKPECSEIQLTDEQKETVSAAVREIRDTFSGQVEGWHQRNVFEKQWIFRDFKKHTGAAPEHFIGMLEQFEAGLAVGRISLKDLESLQLGKLSAYYSHTIDLLKGYEKDPARVKEHTAIINGWIKQISEFEQLIGICVAQQEPI